MLRPSGVSSASDASCAASASSSARDARRRQELRRLAVAQGDGARLVEQQDVHVARRLHRPPAHGEHVLLDHPVDAGDPDGAESPPMVVGMRQTSSATSTVIGKDDARIDAEELEGHDDDQKMIVSAESSMVRAISLGVF